MIEIVEVLKVLEIITSILLVLIILVQNKNVTLSLASMSGWMGEMTKRWPEKIMHNFTIGLWALFILNSLALFILSK